MEILNLHLSNLIKNHQPDLIFYNADYDVHIENPMGKLSLSSDGLLRRGRFVFKTAVDTNLPIVVVLDGGVVTS